MSEPTPLIFVRFTGDKTEVKKILDNLIPTEWMFSHYAIVTAPVDHIDPGPTVRVILKGYPTLTKVLMRVQEGAGRDFVRIKHYAEVPDNEKTRDSATYLTKKTSYPWEPSSNGLSPNFEWHKRDGYMIIRPDCAHVDDAKFVEQKKPMTLAQMREIVGGELLWLRDQRIGRHKAEVVIREGAVKQVTVTNGRTPRFPDFVKDMERNNLIETFIDNKTHLFHGDDYHALYGDIILAVGKAKPGGPR
jgi:hypothetical protein